MEISKGQFWKGTKFRGVVTFVRFIVAIEARLVHYLEYQAGGECPAKGSADSLNWEKDKEQMDAAQANAFIGNMEQQDTEFQARQDESNLQSLVKAMQVLVGAGKINRIHEQDGKVRVEMRNGSSFEITSGKDGFTSAQTGLSDPDW